MLELVIAALVGLLLTAVVFFRYILAGTLWAIRRVARYLNERSRHVLK